MKSQVYILKIGNINVNIDEIFEQLPEYCKNKIGYGKDQILRKSRILSWKVLANILKKCYNINLWDTVIYENDYGKPYIDDIYFNITHSNDYIGIIISDEECGIDIEKIELKVNLDSFARKILTPKEYENASISVDYLIKKWTQKEAYYKTIGDGIKLSKLKEKINDKDIKTIKVDDYYLSFSPITDNVSFLDILQSI